MIFGTPDEPDYSRTKPEFALPEGYDDEESFLGEMRTLFTENMEADRANRDAAIEDLAFVIGSQWDTDTQAKRSKARKPTLTINRLQAFLAQVLGARRQNETQIKVVPDNGGTQDVAQVREDLLRSVQKESRAAAAYDNALMGCVSCGIGNFQLELEYEGTDVFEQKLCINPILDHLAVVWDRRMIDPTGRDADCCFVVDTMSKKDFAKNYPWATPTDIMTNAQSITSLVAQGWYSQDDVRVVSYWRSRTEERVLAMMTTGTTQDITDQMDDPDILSKVAMRPDGNPYVRKVRRPFAQKYICSGTDILEGPYNLPADRIPVFRVPGWEVRIGQQTYRYGMIRFLKDPQRLHNYFRSVLAERLQQTPRAVWLATDQAVAGREKAFRESHMSDDPLLVWNSESGQKPERVAPAQMENALLQQAVLTSQDIKDVSNIHEANLGMPSNEVSGVAIQARQRVSDTGTILYHDNLESAIEECGRVANDLVKVVYDTPRIVKTLGADAQAKLQIINLLGNPESINITEGKYSVSVVTGPTYASKQVEQADTMLKMANAMPQILSVAADLIVGAQSWPDADKIAARLRRAIPPQILGDEAPPDVQQKAAQQGQVQDAQMKLQMAQDTAKYMNDQSMAQLNAARAQHYQAQTAALPAQFQNDQLKTASHLASREIQDHVAVLKI